MTKRREKETPRPLPPDGGWGWVVCAATFVCLAINEGLGFIFGLLYIDLLDYYGEDPGVTAAAGSTYLGAPMLVGPVVAAMIKCCGIRPVAMVGGMIAGTAAAFSTLSPNMAGIIILFGAVSGSAVGMVFLPSLLAVGFYFDKKKGIAYGLASSGTGVGTTLFSTLYTRLEKQYTWKGALLILAGFMLNCVVCGALYRPLRRRTHKAEEPEVAPPDELGEGHSLGGGSIASVEPGDQSVRFRQPKHCNLTYSSLPCLIDETISGKKLSRAAAVSCRANIDQTDISTSFADKEWGVQEPREEDTSKLPEQERTSRLWRFVRMTAELFGLGMLLDPDFLMVSLIMALWVSFSILLIILPHYSILVGVSESQSSSLVTVLGITNVIGRLVLGFVADRWLSPIWVYTAVLFLGSVSSLLIPFTTTYWCLMVEAAAFGATFGTLLSLRQVVLLDFVGVDKLINAFGLVSMFQGVAYLAGPPIAGRLYSYTNSYRESFLVISVAYALAGLLCIPIGLKIRRQNRNFDTELEQTNS